MTDVITPKMLQDFSIDLRDARPPTPTEREVTFTRFPQVTSFAPAVTNASFIVRFRMKDGATVDMEMNPVVAQHLGHCIAHMGVQAGWLDGLGGLISPPMPEHDA